MRTHVNNPPTVNTMPHAYTLTIMPDFGSAYAWVKSADDFSRFVGINSSLLEEDIECELGFAAFKVPSWLIDELVEWQRTFEIAEHEGIRGKGALSWEDFHRRGLFLAALVQQAVAPYHVMVRYSYPAEDAVRRELPCVILDPRACNAAKFEYLQITVPQLEWSFNTLRDTLLATGSPIEQAQLILNNVASAWGLQAYELDLVDPITNKETYDDVFNPVPGM